jgi:lysozyme family protein
MNYTPEFNESFNRLIDVEKGLSNDPNDPGNWTGGRVGAGILKGTKYGISAATYPHINIADLTVDDAKAIYWNDWWIAIAAGDLHPAIVYQMWQFAVNAGMVNAKRGLQSAVGAAQDGVIGPRTLAAVRAAELNDIILGFNAFMLEYYADLSTWDRYGKGWARRVAKQLRYAAKDN